MRVTPQTQTPTVIPAHSHVIPAHSPVIPAQAGTQRKTKHAANPLSLDGRGLG